MTKPFLFLTSTGLGDAALAKAFLKELGKKPAECRLLLVAYAQDAHERRYIKYSEVQISELGFKDIVVANLHNKIDTEKLGDFDVIYGCGGGTYGILKKMRERKIGRFIVAQVKRDCAFVGVSASSIIAGPSIRIAGWGSEADENDVGLVNLRGLGLTEIAVFPHFRPELKAEVEAFSKKVKYPVQALTDAQALLIRGGKVTLVGKEKS